MTLDRLFVRFLHLVYRSTDLLHAFDHILACNCDEIFFVLWYFFMFMSFNISSGLNSQLRYDLVKLLKLERLWERSVLV